MAPPAGTGDAMLLPAVGNQNSHKAVTSAAKGDIRLLRLASNGLRQLGSACPGLDVQCRDTRRCAHALAVAAQGALEIDEVPGGQFGLLPATAELQRPPARNYHNQFGPERRPAGTNIAAFAEDALSARREPRNGLGRVWPHMPDPAVEGKIINAHIERLLCALNLNADRIALAKLGGPTRQPHLEAALCDGPAPLHFVERDQRAAERRRHHLHADLRAARRRDPLRDLKEAGSLPFIGNDAGNHRGTLRRSGAPAKLTLNLGAANTAESWRAEYRRYCRYQKLR